jgi:cation-transporting ATPase E
MAVEAQRAPARGLTSAEADVRRRRGEANVAVGGTSRGDATILRRGAFSIFNVILFVIGSCRWRWAAAATP